MGAAAASAATTHSFDPATAKLSIYGTDAPDQIKLDCGGGGGSGTNVVRVNGVNLVPLIPCGTVKAIYIIAYGANDTIDTTAVSPALGFTGLPAPTPANGPSAPLTVVGADGDDTVIDGDYSSFLGGEAGNNTITGGGGDDYLAGDGAAFSHDIYNGGAGNDQILGSAGPDLLLGGAGKDQIHGFKGKDKEYGGTGKDELDGSYGNDKLIGQAGYDKAEGGPGTDKCIAEQKSNCEL